MTLDGLENIASDLQYQDFRTMDGAVSPKQVLEGDYKHFIQTIQDNTEITDEKEIVNMIRKS